MSEQWGRRGVGEKMAAMGTWQCGKASARMRVMGAAVMREATTGMRRHVLPENAREYRSVKDTEELDDILQHHIAKEDKNEAKVKNKMLCLRSSL